MLSLQDKVILIPPALSSLMRTEPLSSNHNDKRTHIVSALNNVSPYWGTNEISCMETENKPENEAVLILSMAPVFTLVAATNFCKRQ